MIAALILTLCSSCNENLTISCLDGPKTNGYIEVNVENLPLLLVDISVVIVDGTLVKLEEMDLVYLHIPFVIESVLSVLYLGYGSLHHLLRHEFI